MEKTRQILALTKNLLIAVRRLSGDGLALSVSLRSPRPGCGSQRLLRCRSHPAGRGPNSSSLFPPLAAVVAVAPKGRAKRHSFGRIFSIHAGNRAIRAGFVDFFPADVVYSKQPDILRSHHFFSPFKGGFCMLSYRKLAMRVLGRPLHTGGDRFTPSGLSAGSSVYPDCRNAHHPCRPGFCRYMAHRKW